MYFIKLQRFHGFPPTANSAPLTNTLGNIFKIMFEKYPLTPCLL